MSQKLRDLIRSVRSCKTAAEERAVIAKESALIRTAFKEHDRQHCYRNVAKLLFIHMLGYPSHFGQMECVKLIASPLFGEKRMGYLGLILLLTDQEDVLTLVTNSMKIDLSNQNQFIVALSLNAVGNIASPDMARDLVMDIDKHLRGENDYLRKKAALAAIRVFRKVPELVEDFVDSILSLLKSKNHGVLLCGVQLITEIVRLDDANSPYFRNLVPTLVRELRNLLSMGYSSEYDVSGIADPFLQVALLALLRLLGKHNDDASEAMNDVLAQVATNTETAKTAGNAILYECVNTIMAIESDAGLKVLAINILGRFLLNRDNNIRYVALNTLSKVIVDDAAAVQRHTNTIVDCLKDPDTSIRQRALELIYALVNETNIQSLAREMLNYLVVAPTEQKSALCSRIADAVDRYAPSTRWHIDTLITMLSIAGASLADESISSALILLIQRNPELHAYVVHKLFWALHDDISQLALVHVGLWCIGEYGRALLHDPATPEDASASTASLSDKTRVVDENAVVDLLQRVLRSHHATDTTKAYALNAMVKLTTRFSEVPQLQQLATLIATFNTSVVLDLQQRATEYTTLGQPEWTSLRPDILATMPAIDVTKLRTRQSRLASTAAAPFDGASSSNSVELIGNDDDLMPTSATSAKAPLAAAATPNLLDLDDIFGSNAPPSAAAAVAPSIVATAPQPPAVDLLADLFAPPTTSTTTTAAAAPPPPASASNAAATDLLGLLDFGAAPQAQAPPTIRAYDKNGLSVDLVVTKPNSNDASITFIAATIRNATAMPLENFLFLAAFPKYIKLKMEPASSNVVPPHNAGVVTQVVKIQNSMHGEKPVLMRIKLEFTVHGTKVEEMAAVSNFPADV